MSPDVVIVGAGIVGCAAADELCRRGHTVTLIDQRTVAAGATQASAGILAPYIEGHDLSPLLELAARSLSMYDDFVERAREESGQAIDYQRRGTLEVALNDAETKRLREQEQRLRELRIACRWLTQSDVREAEPAVSDHVECGFLVETHGLVSAPDLCAALLRAAASRGATLVPHAAARRISRRGDVLSVEADAGSFSAPHVVLATGSWSARLEIEGVAAPPVRPVRGQLLSLSRVARPLGRVVWGAGCYLVPRADGRVLVGATSEEVGFDERVTVTGVRDLLESACELVPELWQATFDAARVGLRPATPDGMPIIGRSARMPGLVFATGHFRNGILLAPLTAKLVSELVEGRSDDAALRYTQPQRFGEL